MRLLKNLSILILNMNYIEQCTHFNSKLPSRNNSNIEINNDRYTVKGANSKTSNNLSSTLIKNERISFEVDNSILQLVKMTFIFSATMDGWRVEKLSRNKFVFSKKNVTKHITLQSFIKKHLHRI